MKKSISVKKLIMVLVATVVCSITIFAVSNKAFAIDAYGRAVGIDVSAHQSTIDWASVKNSGIDFAIIRIGIGDNVPEQHDRQAERNMSECESKGIPYGVYIYSYALTEKEVLSEADHVVTMIAGHNPTLGIWFDMEDADNYKYNHAFNPYQHGKELTNFCLLFMRTVKSMGYSNVGVYANKNYFSNILDYYSICSEGMIWLAHWGISSPSLGCELWQYSSDGDVAGIGGRVDMDYIYPDSILMSRINQSGEYYQYVELEPGQGDVDNDGEATSVDYVMIKNHISGNAVITDEEALKRADVDGDGVITANDYIQVKYSIMSK